MDGESRHASVDHRLERLIFFSDAVFAIAITLLIIEVKVPNPGFEATSGQWLGALTETVPHFIAFVLSFMVIGSIWASHHAIFSLVSGFHQRLVWPNLHLLLAVAFVPFSSGVVANASLSPVPFALYAASLLAAALFKARLTGKALQPDLITPGASGARVALELRWRWVMPAVTLLTLLLAFVIPAWNSFALLLMPLARRLPRYRRPREDAEASAPVDEVAAPLPEAGAPSTAEPA